MKRTYARKELFAEGGYKVFVTKALLPQGIRGYYWQHQDKWLDVLRESGLQISNSIAGDGGRFPMPYFNYCTAENPPSFGSKTWEASWEFECRAERAVGTRPTDEDRTALLVKVAASASLTATELFLVNAVEAAFPALQTGRCSWER